MTMFRKGTPTEEATFRQFLKNLLRQMWGPPERKPCPVQGCGGTAVKIADGVLTGRKWRCQKCGQVFWG